MFFISPEKLFSFLRYLKFCSDCLSHVGKRHDKKVKVIFKFPDVTNWETINYYIHIAEYLKKWGKT